jgi:uncharacterized membrane protein (UPF0127 family)
MRKILGIIFLSLFLASSGYTDSISSIKIFNSSDSFVEYTVEVVSSQESQQRGLMFRENLNSNEGMLFLFKVPKKASFWMKNTLISLDLIFIKENGKVDSIYQNLEPLSLKSIKSKSKVKAALEIPGGHVELHGINQNSYINIGPIE